MNDPLQYNFLSTAVHTAGTVLIAGLLLPLGRAVPGRFLAYWTLGWMALAVGLLCVFLSVREAGFKPVFLTGYCLAEYLFGFLLWAGCREAATGRRLRRDDFILLAPLAGFAAVGPAVFDGLRGLFPAHAAVMAGLFLIALLATRRLPPHTRTAGRWVFRGALVGLTLLFTHYAVVTGYLTYYRADGVLDYMAFASLYDTLFQMVLAFGMVQLAVDRLLDALEGQNRQLAAATEELARAARTDALTGLLNRRALDQLAADLSGRPPDGTLAVLDLNDLKELNDRHGHHAGDAAIQLVARALRSGARITDLIYRMGGDEFLIVMPGCGAGDLAVRLAKLDEVLAGQRLPGVGEPVDLVVAWGVAEYAGPADFDAAYDRADQAMYAQKRRRKVSRTPPPTAAAAS
jgi:diguanylate cyclase (GGDEF)-like protein